MGLTDSKTEFTSRRRGVADKVSSEFMNHNVFSMFYAFK